MKKIFMILGMILGMILVLFMISACDQQATMRDMPPESMPAKDMMPPGAPEKEEEMFSYMDISPSEAKEMIDNNPEMIIIDVSPKYDEGHIPGAVNYYVGDGSLDKAIPMLDKEASYLVYCHVDSASIAGAEKLINAGVKDVYRLEGNYKAWVDAGYPVEM